MASRGRNYNDMYLLLFQVFYSRFSLDVNKIQTRRSSILQSFYFHEVLQQLNIFIYKNVRFERDLDFLIEDA